MAAATNVNATILCTECNHQSTFPKVYLSMGTRKSFTYFCGNCGTVTLHTITQTEAPVAATDAGNVSSASNANVSINEPQAGSPSAGAGVSRFRYDPTRHSASRPVQEEEVPAELSSDELWGKLLKQLADSQVPLADLFRCDDATRMRMFAALGFEKYDQDRLLILSKERDPKNLVSSATPTSPPGASPVPTATSANTPVNTSAASRGLNSSNNAGFGLYGQQGPPLAPQQPSSNNATPRSGVNYAGWKPQGGAGAGRVVPHSQRAPSIPGVYMHGENMVARCTVYPDLPAEFWCCACNCLVSSRCHVQGIHKDHPFISMRLAAETYVRDTAAWADRCRTQLNITNTVMGNLSHSHGILDQAVNHQFEALDRNVDQIVKDICAWRDQLKSDVIQQVTAEHMAIEQALQQAQELHQLYSDHLKEAEPLLGNMPPATQHDSSSDDWALKFLDFVTRLKHVNADPVTMPKILVPEVRCMFSTPMVMDLLKHVSNPISIRLPDIIDPGYFHYPHPTTSTRTPFILSLPQDGRQKGVVVENSRTLTRAPETAPSHTLVTGSQIFYSGTSSWEVHVDRVGHGVGRILAGVIIQGSDGEGVVWDGYRIVGPNEGESRTISDKFKIKPGTILRFVLELDAPNSYLNCFFEKEGVARIPLPPASSGWVPAFSVFGPQDQITVVPTQGAGAMEGSIPKNSGANPMTTQHASQSDMLTRAKLEQQELLIASLQKQLDTISTKVDVSQQQQQIEAGPNQHHHRARGQSTEPKSAQRTHSRHGPSIVTPRHEDPSSSAMGVGRMNADGSSPPSRGPVAAAGGPATRTASGAVTGPTHSARGIGSQYSPELAQLLRFVDEIK